MTTKRIAATLTTVAVLLGLVSVGVHHIFVHRRPLVVRDERWRPELLSVQNLDEAYPIVDEYIARARGTHDERVAGGVISFVSDRFVHGAPMNHYADNWISRVAALVWPNLGMPVTPDSILKHRHALCSQQTIVAEALLRHYGLHFASVGARWPNPDPSSRGHFALAAKIDGVWRYYDADLEAAVQGAPLSDLRRDRAIRLIYANRPIVAREFTYAAAHNAISIEGVDANPAPRGAIFEISTRLLSKWGWAIVAEMSLVAWTIVGLGAQPATSWGRQVIMPSRQFSSAVVG